MVGLSDDELYVPSDNKIIVINTTNGKVVSVKKFEFDEAAFCDGLWALAGEYWVALVEANSGRVLWNITADWSPTNLTFSPDCKYLFVSSGNEVYALRDGKAVDSVSDSNFIFSVTVCKSDKGYLVFTEGVDLESLSNMLNDLFSKVFITFKGYYFSG